MPHPAHQCQWPNQTCSTVPDGQAQQCWQHCVHVSHSHARGGDPAHALVVRATLMPAAGLGCRVWVWGHSSCTQVPRALGGSHVACHLRPVHVTRAAVATTPSRADQGHGGWCASSLCLSVRANPSCSSCCSWWVCRGQCARSKHQAAAASVQLLPLCRIGNTALASQSALESALCSCLRQDVMTAMQKRDTSEAPTYHTCPSHVRLVSQASPAQPWLIIGPILCGTAHSLPLVLPAQSSARGTTAPVGKTSVREKADRAPHNKKATLPPPTTLPQLGVYLRHSSFLLPPKHVR